MNCYSELGRLTVYIFIAPPEKSEKISVIRIYIHLMEHLFHVTGESNGFLMEATEDSVKTVGEIRTLKKMSVKGLSLKLCTGIKDDVDLVRFLRVENTMMRYIPNSTIREVKFLVRNPLSLSFDNHLLHEGFIMFPILSVSLQPMFEPFEET